jgi:hypothetical protein
MIDWRFTAVYLIAAAVLLVTEIVAVVTGRGRKGSTITENVRAALDKSVLLWFVALGAAIWGIVHLFGFGIVDSWIRSWY